MAKIWTLKIEKGPFPSRFELSESLSVVPAMGLRRSPKRNRKYRHPVNSAYARWQLWFVRFFLHRNLRTNGCCELLQGGIQLD